MKQLTPNPDSVTRVLEITEKIEALKAQIAALEAEKAAIVQADYRAARDKEQAAARKYSPAKERALKFLVERNAHISKGRGDRLWYSDATHASLFGEPLRISTFDCLLTAGFISKAPRASDSYGIPDRYTITDAGRQALAAWNTPKKVYPPLEWQEDN